MGVRNYLGRTSYKVLPPPTRRRLLRRYYRLRGKRIVNILHISKTGGTAVKHAVRNNTVTENHALILHSHEITLHDIPSGESVVFFLRDPVRRFVSAFSFQHRQGGARYDSPWSDEEARIFAEFPTPNDLALALSSENPAVRQRAAFAMRSIKHLRRTQAEWIGTQAYLLSRLPDVLLIGFQESLDQDFEQLKSLVGLPDTVSLPTDPVLANRSNGSDLVELDAQAVRNLRKWYAKDYELIELCREIAASVNSCAVESVSYSGQTA